MVNYYLRLADTAARLARGWRPVLLALLAMLLSLGASAQKAPGSFFSDDAGAKRAAGTSPLATALRAARPLTLDVPGLRAALAKAPLEGRAGAALLVTLPLPDGTNARFRVVEAPIMAPDLAARFPSIKTYTGVGIDDPAASLRLDLTPAGFHAQVLSATTGSFFIDPVTRTDTEHYLSFWKRDMPGRSFDCDVKDSDSGARRTDGSSLRTSGPVLRTYRLALAATGEYTAFQGGTVTAAFTAMVTSVNRVVGVYEKELAVRMILVSGTTSLIYTDPATDPYTNSNGSTMLTENQTNVDALIGSAGYDIGHVFSTGGGGVAGLGVVCRNGSKAQGVTGSSRPVSDAFDIDYVAHEMGHEFGGNHTFNGVAGNCGGGNRNAGTAYEPGSGSTIMAYAGICTATDNLQPNSDPYFHVASYEEIQAYLGTTSCAVTTATGNAPPLITLPAGGKVLPIGTPFKLTASAFDPDNDALSYCWEQYDRVATGGPPAAAQVAGTAIPLFRSFNPTADPTRYFPRLSDLVANTTNIGERLPTVTRALTFRVTVRDQNNGSQGIIGGVNSSPTVTLSSTSAAGPFLVTAPDAAGVSWAGGSSQPVTWSVAGTTANGVNCATVNVRLSTDGGLTYPTLLLSGTANDGSEAVTLPNLATTTARIMVEAADNYFFDISNNNFAITTSMACAAPTALAVSSITRTSASLSFTGSGAASYVIRTEPATTTQTVTDPTASLTGLVAGTTYTVFVQGDCGSAGLSAATAATFSTLAPPVCNPATNLQLAATTATSATVTFTASTSGPADYTVTTSPATTTQTVTASPLTFTGLAPGTTYTVTIQSNCTSAGLTGTETLTFTTRPLNDECTAAVALTPGATCVTTAGSILGATESQPANPCSGDLSSLANDVWYSFVATGPSYGITASSAFDGVLEVLGGSCGSLSSLGCSDVIGTNGSERVGLTGLVAGNTYYVRYFAYNGTAGTGAFTICVQGTLSDLIVSTPQAVGGAYYNVTVTGTGTATLSDNLTVFGAMTVQSGGSVTTSTTYDLLGPGSFTLAAGATLTETNTVGIVNTATSTGGFVFSNIAPSFSIDANYVFAGTAAQVTGALLPRNVRNLTVNNAAGLSLSAAVNVAQVLRLQSGNLTLGTRRLLLRSTTAGTALVDNTGGVVNGTTAAMQRALTGGASGTAYRHYSSPVATMRFDSLRTGGFVPVVNAAYNTSATPGTVTPFPTVFGYDQGRVATAASNYSDFDKGWLSPAALTETMTPTRGYTVQAPSGSTPVRFTGTFNTGAQNSGALDRGPATDAGWQLLGNPYPSPLDWGTVTTAQRPGVGGALYVYQSTGQYAGTYRAYVNNLGGASPLVEAGSGYFVQVTTAGTSGAVNLTNANRVTTFGTQNAFGRTAADLRPQLRLRVAGADLADETYVYFEGSATAGFDAEYDAQKLPNTSGLNLASLAGATPLAIQGLPPLASTGEVVVPLTLAVPTAGSFAFEAADLANFPSGMVYLRDAQTGTQQLLAAGTTYAFTLATATAGSARFALVFRPAGVLATQAALSAAQVRIFPNPAHGSFSLLLPPVAGQRAVQATLLTVLGQHVLSRTVALTAAGATAEFDTHSLAAGVYVLRLTAGNETLVQRVTVE